MASRRRAGAATGIRGRTSRARDGVHDGIHVGAVVEGRARHRRARARRSAPPTARRRHHGRQRTVGDETRGRRRGGPRARRGHPTHDSPVRRRVGPLRAHRLRLLARELAQISKRGGPPHEPPGTHARRRTPVARGRRRQGDRHGRHGDDRRRLTRRDHQRRRRHRRKHQTEAQRGARVRRQAGHRRRGADARHGSRGRASGPGGHHGRPTRRAPGVEDTTGGPT